MIGEGDEAWKAIFDVSLMGANRLVTAALPYLEQSSASSVVFISSTAGLEHFVGAPSYAAIKASLIAHGNELAYTLAANEACVNSVSPGAVYFDGSFWDAAKREMPEFYEVTVNRTAMGRLGKPEEIACCVKFLVSPESSSVTGSNLVVDAAASLMAHKKLSGPRNAVCLEAASDPERT